MKKSLVLSLIAIALVSGCANQRFNMSSAAGTPRYEDSQTFWLSGIGQNQVVDAAKVCGGADKVVAVETIQSPLNIVFGMITFGIYTPRDAKVMCK